MTTNDDQLAPEFAIALRGYDRLQVDEYVSQLNAWMAEAETRQSIAESWVADRDRHIETLQHRIRELESEQHTGTASVALDEARERVAHALDDVVKTCNELHTQTQARCAKILDGARKDALAVVNAAHATVAELEAVAKDDARTVIDDANNYRTSARSEVDRLRAEHQQVLQQLSQLRGSLEGLISAPAAVLAAVDDITSQHADPARHNGTTTK